MSGESGRVIGLKAHKRRIEHFPAGDENHIESRRRLLFSEQLTGKTLGPVPHNSGAEFSCGSNAEPAHRAPAWRHEESHEPAGQSQAVLVRLLELRTSSDPLVPGEALRHRALAALLLVRDGQPLSTFRPAALQHDAAIFRRHPHAESVGLAAAPRVGLKRALPLCHCDYVLHELIVEKRVSSNSQY
jgi:hypothetical protein